MPGMPAWSDAVSRTTPIAVSTRDRSGGKAPMPLSIDIEDVTLAPDRLQVDRV